MGETTSNDITMTNHDERKNPQHVAQGGDPGFRWFDITKTLKKLERMTNNGLFILFCASFLNFTYFFNGIERDSFTTRWFGQANILIATMWHIGASSGAIICGFNRYAWSVRVTNKLASYLLLISATLLCVRDFVWIDAYVLACVARYLAGFTFGFIYITTTALIGDNVWKMVRGYMAATMSMSIYAALVLAMMLEGPVNNSNISSYHLIGYLMVIGCSILFIISAHFTETCEPLTRLLSQDKVNEAKWTFMILCENVDVPVVHSEFEEKVKMLSEDYEDGDCFWLHLFGSGNWKPILMVGPLRVLNVLLTNLYLLNLSGHYMAIYEWGVSSFVMQLAIAGIYFFFPIIPKYALDKIGRKSILYVSGIGSGISYLVLNVTGGVVPGIKESFPIVVFIATLFLHIFVSVGITSVQHLYAIEAFPLSKRNASLAFITCIEYIGHAFINFLWISEHESTLKYLMSSTPIIVIFVTFLSFIKLPATESKSLRKCRGEFNNFYTKFLIQPRHAEI